MAGLNVCEWLQQLRNSIDVQLINQRFCWIRLVSASVSALMLWLLSSYETCAAVNIYCANPTKGAITMSQDLCLKYPFDLRDTNVIDSCSETKEPIHIFYQNFSLVIALFTLVIVLSGLYAVAAGTFYLSRWGQYHSNSRIAFFDFLATAGISVYWMVGSMAYWSTISQLAMYSSDASLSASLLQVQPCSDESVGKCSVTKGDWAHLHMLYIVLIFGVAQMLLWSLNANWILTKVRVMRAIPRLVAENYDEIEDQQEETLYQERPSSRGSGSGMGNSDYEASLAPGPSASSYGTYKIM